MDGSASEDCLNACTDSIVVVSSPSDCPNSIKMPDLSSSADSAAVKGVGGDLQNEPQISEKVTSVGSPRFGQLIADAECKLADLSIGDGRRSAREDRKADDDDNSEDEYYDISSEASNELHSDPKDDEEEKSQLKATDSDSHKSSQESIAQHDPIEDQVCLMNCNKRFRTNMIINSKNPFYDACRTTRKKLLRPKIWMETKTSAIRSTFQSEVLFTSMMIVC